MRTNQTVKGLQSQLLLLQGEITALKTAIGNKQRELSLKEKTANSLSEQIKALNNPSDPQVSEHAVLRYLERVRGVNIDEVKKEILSEDLIEAIGKVGGTFKWKKDGHEVVLKDNVVVTVV